MSIRSTCSSISPSPKASSSVDLELANFETEGVRNLLRDGRFMIGLSDGGAHVEQLCDAGLYDASARQMGPGGAGPDPRRGGETDQLGPSRFLGTHRSRAHRGGIACRSRTPGPRDRGSQRARVRTRPTRRERAIRGDRHGIEATIVGGQMLYRIRGVPGRPAWGGLAQSLLSQRPCLRPPRPIDVRGRSARAPLSTLAPRPQSARQRHQAALGEERAIPGPDRRRLWITRVLCELQEPLPQLVLRKIAVVEGTAQMRGIALVRAGHSRRGQCNQAAIPQSQARPRPDLRKEMVLAHAKPGIVGGNIRIDLRLHLAAFPTSPSVCGDSEDASDTRTIASIDATRVVGHFMTSSFRSWVRLRSENGLGEARAGTPE